MSTIPAKILTTFAVAAAIAAGSLTAAEARAYRHHHYSAYRPYVFQPGYWRAPRYYYGGAYAYHSGYPRIPIYNHDDATKLSRQMMGLWD